MRPKVAAGSTAIQFGFVQATRLSVNGDVTVWVRIVPSNAGAVAEKLPLCAVPEPTAKVEPSTATMRAEIERSVEQVGAPAAPLGAPPVPVPLTSIFFGVHAGSVQNGACSMGSLEQPESPTSQPAAVPQNHGRIVFELIRSGPLWGLGPGRARLDSSAMWPRLRV